MWTTGKGGPSTSGAVVEQVESFKFLCVHINNELEWSKHTKTVMKRARQSLFPLRKLKRLGRGPEILKRFYGCNIESMVASLSGTAIARPPTAMHYRGSKLPAIQDLCTRWCQMKALKIVKDSRHSSRRLFSLLPHGTGVPSLGPRSF